MKDSEQDVLLNVILASESVENLRRSSLKQALRVVRNQHRARQTVLVCVLGFALLAPVLLLVYQRPELSIELGRNSGGAAAEQTVTPRQENSLERIGDEELLALFPDQTVALLGAPGNRRLLVFASSASPSSVSH